MRIAATTLVLAAILCFAVTDAWSAVRFRRQASATPSTSPSTRLSTSAPSTQADATTFPTPAELIAKIKSNQKAKDALPHIAHFDLSDAIMEKPPEFSIFGDNDATTLRSLIDRLHKARDDKDIRAVLITFGAETDLKLAQAEEIRAALAEISKSGKPTFVHADSFDTPTYIAACGANHICMLEGGDILLPGVGMEAMFARGLLDKVGVKADYIQIGEYKGADEEMTRTGPSEQLKGELNKLSDSLYQEIVDTISSSRNLKSDEVREIIDDSMMNGAAAKKRGLVDHLLDQDGLRDLIATQLKIKDKKIEIVHDYGKESHDDVDFSNPLALFASIASRHDEPSGKPEVALVYLSGVITDGDGGRSFTGEESAGSEELRKAFRMAARDENIKAVVIRIDSPGGSALASEVIWQAARHSEAKKPLFVSVGSMAASGGYYVASASDRIFADPGAIVGSIGVVGGKFVYADLMAKLGVNTESFTRGQNANLFSSTQPFTDHQRKMVTAWMKETYDQFTERVMTTRKGKIENIDNVARGRIFSARQGKTVGLVDEIGGLQQAITYAAKKVNLSEGDYDVRVLPPPRTLADMLTGRDSTDTKSPLHAQITISPDSLLRALDPAARVSIGQQLQALELLQRHPVLLMTPFTVTFR